jgi:hypothetical protein
MAGTTWTKFYWGDWMSDAQLRRCSPAARALWMDMLCIAAQHDPVGFVAVRGEPLQPEEIARMTGFPAAAVVDLLTELERNGVYSRDRQGRIYSRRMVRDANRSNEGRKAASKRWSQASEKKGEKPPPNGVPKGVPIPHIPDTNSQNITPRSPPDDFDGWLRGLVGTEPVLVDPDTGPIRALLADGLTRGDIAAGIAAAMARPGFRPRAWGQLAGWIRRAAKDRLAAGPKAATPASPAIPDESWLMVMRRYRETGEWHPAFGPVGGADCPPHIRAMVEAERTAA